jgi:hypothetical protein
LNAGEEPACTSGVSRTISAPAGSYRVVARSPDDESVTPYVGSWDLQSGYSYRDCYYIRTRLLP